jgi:hypothetical protein
VPSEESKVSVSVTYAPSTSQQRPNSLMCKLSDVEFDLENDRQKCLHNLVENNLFSPSDVRRVFDLFENPVFYSGTAKSAEIVQGEAQDCYLVSALSSITSVAGLVEGFCVAVSHRVQLFIIY